MRNSYRKIFMMCPAMLLLSSCYGPSFSLVSAGIGAASQGYFSRPDINLTEKNYAAADYLVSRAKGYISKTDLIEFYPLHEADNEGVTSAFGYGVSEEVGLRFNELGYKVSMSRVGGQGMSRDYDYAPNETPQYDFSGFYIREGRDLKVSLRLIGHQSGKVIATFEYTLPVNSEIRNLSQTPAQIYRVQ